MRERLTSPQENYPGRGAWSARLKHGGGSLLASGATHHPLTFPASGVTLHYGQPVADSMRHERESQSSSNALVDAGDLDRPGRGNRRLLALPRNHLPGTNPDWHWPLDGPVTRPLVCLFHGASGENSLGLATDQRRL